MIRPNWYCGVITSKWYKVVLERSEATERLAIGMS